MHVSVNYRGSTGFGQDGIESLLGNIGTQDVKDVHVSIEGYLGEAWGRVGGLTHI